MSKPNCPTADELSAWLTGHLIADPHRGDVETHLDGCAACQATIQELEDQQDELVRALQEGKRESWQFAEADHQDAIQRVLQNCAFESAASQTSINGSLKPPKIVGRYRLLEKLGEGGMGTVYKAIHTDLNKVVAIKLLPQHRLWNGQAVARFRREMRAVGQLNHPHLVAATDAGEADSMHFLVMEYVEGCDFSKLMRYCQTIDVADACELIRQAATGLQHIAERGMVHRDIKPSNLILTEAPAGIDGATDGESPPAALVKILDLGLALLNEASGHDLDEGTASGQYMGTLEYMAPEQLADTHRVDVRADIYSLGATLYKLLCGKSPLAGEQPMSPAQMMVALATQSAPSLAIRRRDLPAELVGIVDRMLARSPDERFSSPREVAQALRPFAATADLRSLLRRAASAQPKLSTADVATVDYPSGTSRDPDAKDGSGAQLRTRKPSLWTRVSDSRLVYGSTIVFAGILVSLLIWFLATGQHGSGSGLGLTDHDVARWVLSQGGNVAIAGDGDTIRPINDADALPSPPVKLVTIRFENSDKIRDADLTRLASLQHLDALLLNNVEITDDGLKHLTGLTSLRYISLQRLLISSEGLMHLRDMQRLTHLSLFQSTHIDDRATGHLIALPELRILDLRGTSLTERGYTSLAGAAKLDELSVGPVDADQLRGVANCRQIRVLRITSSAGLNDALQELAKLDRLTSLRLDGCDLGDAGLQHLQSFNQLTLLDCSYASLTDDAVTDLSKLTKLQSLNLTGTRISRAGISALRSSLPDCEILAPN